MDSKQLAQYIDHTALTAEKTEQDIKDEEAGKLVFSYGTEDVEVKTMRQVTWEEGNLVFDIIAGDDTVDMDTLVDMAEDMIRA